MRDRLRGLVRGPCGSATRLLCTRRRHRMHRREAQARVRGRECAHAACVGEPQTNPFARAVAVRSIAKRVE